MGVERMAGLLWKADVATNWFLLEDSSMNPEHYKIRIEGKRVIIAVASEGKLAEIFEALCALGALPVGPSAWLCDVDVSLARLASVIGELAEGEVVYSSAYGSEHPDFGFFVAPNTEGGIVIAPRD